MSDHINVCTALAVDECQRCGKPETIRAFVVQGDYFWHALHATWFLTGDGPSDSAVIPVHDQRFVEDLYAGCGHDPDDKTVAHMVTMCRRCAGITGMNVYSRKRIEAGEEIEIRAQLDYEENSGSLWEDES